jgi:TonB family protein
MIAAWMLFSIFTGCALTVAAAAADRLASFSKRPRRFIWLTTLVATSCWPIIAVVRTGIAPLSSSSTSDPGSLLQGAQRLSSFIVLPSFNAIDARWSLSLLVTWVLVSTLLIGRLTLAIWYVRRGQTSWKKTRIDGMDVHVAPSVGPAVVGLHPMRVVLPEWVLELEPPLRALVLRHEAEHQGARDPYLLLVATLVTALIPWNVALWWQARRLRLAIEIDCDTRVLNVHYRRQEYAHLLVTIAQRRGDTAHRLAPALSEPTSNLEKRIIAMRTTPTLSRFRVVCLSAGGAAAFALACSVDTPATPDHSSPQPVAKNAAQSVSSAQSVDPARNVFFEFQVKQPVAQLPGVGVPKYPAALRAARVEGEVLAQFVVNEDGKADRSTLKIVNATNELFSAAVRSAVPQMRFSAAEVDNHKVKQLVQQSFQFKLDR